MVEFLTAFLFVENPDMRKYVIRELYNKGLENIDQEFIDLFLMHFFSFFERVNKEAIAALEFLTPKIRLTVFLEHFDTFLNHYFTALNQIFFYENISLQDAPVDRSSNGSMHEAHNHDETTKLIYQYDITELDAFYYLNFNLDTELETRIPGMQTPFQFPNHYINMHARTHEDDFFDEIDEYEEDISEGEREYRKDKLYNKLNTMFIIFHAIRPVILNLKSLEIIERMKFLIIRNGFRNLHLEYGSPLTQLIVNIKHLSNTYILCLLDFKEELLQFLENDLSRINHFSNPDLLFNILYHSDSMIASNILTKTKYTLLKTKKIIASPYSYLMLYRTILKHKLQGLYESLKSDLMAAVTGNNLMWLYILILALISERAQPFINEIFDLFITIDHPSIRKLIRYFLINLSLKEESLLFFDFKYQQDTKALSIINEFKLIIRDMNSAQKDHGSDIIL